MRFIAILFLVFTISVARAEDPAKPITTAEAAKKIDEQVVLQMAVQSSSLRDGVCFLNSKSDHRDADNFTIFIGRSVTTKFKETKIEDPAAHFKGKTVRVKGKVTRHRDKPQIALEKPDQIEVVEIKPATTTK